MWGTGWGPAGLGVGCRPGRVLSWMWGAGWGEKAGWPLLDVRCRSVVKSNPQRGRTAIGDAGSKSKKSN